MRMYVLTPSSLAANTQREKRITILNSPPPTLFVVAYYVCELVYSGLQLEIETMSGIQIEPGCLLPPPDSTILIHTAIQFRLCFIYNIVYVYVIFVKLAN